VDCRGFEDRLDALLDGSASRDERREADEHLASCPRCRELESLVRGGPGLSDSTAPADLTSGVLARTGASPCRRSHDLLAEHVDGGLDPVDDELMRLHLERCEPCSALARAAARLGDDLPTLAEEDPDPRFVADVLAATSRRPRRELGLAARLMAAWERVVLRPRFALEGAYVGAMVILLLFGAPFSPLRDVPSRALEAVRADSGSPTLPPGVVEFGAQVRGRGERAWEATRRTIRGSYDGISAGIGERVEKAGGVARNLRREGTEIGKAVLDGDLDVLLETIGSEDAPSEPAEAGQDAGAADQTREDARR
jgi:anti-sigma factor RsiW